jgi:hypothetical protein
MRKLLVGAAALLASLTGVMTSASPAEAAWSGHGGAGGFHGGGARFHGGGYGYRGGGYGYRGGWGYRGWGLGPGLVAGLAVGAALAGPYYYGPPGPYYPGYYGYGCARRWVWTGYGYRPVRACY